MENIKNINVKKWIRPWNTEKFDDLYNRDDRYFSLLIKGILSWLNNNIVLYNKPINHFISNTGSSYLYIEKNGYEYSISETSGEDTIYMQMPRCIVEIGDINIPFEELTQPFARGNYERRDNNDIKGFNSEIRRLPIELDISLKYVLGTFNESLILIQELIDKIVFQKYFTIVYLGQNIMCSMEYPSNQHIEINKIDMTSPDVNQKTIEIQLKINSNYPVINDLSEISTAKVIGNFDTNIKLNQDIEKYKETVEDTHNFKIE